MQPCSAETSGCTGSRRRQAHEACWNWKAAWRVSPWRVAPYWDWCSTRLQAQPLATTGNTLRQRHRPPRHRSAHESRVRCVDDHESTDHDGEAWCSNRSENTQDPAGLAGHRCRCRRRTAWTESATVPRDHHWHPSSWASLPVWVGTLRRFRFATSIAILAVAAVVAGQLSADSKATAPRINSSPSSSR